MLTHSKNPTPKRKDLPWLLFLTALLWISGTVFFHSPWEPYEPFVVAVVKSIICTNSWLIPYITYNFPYLDLQPFYFWLYAVIIKIFNFSDIANAIRVINSFIIVAVIYFMGKIGSGLKAYKNGRSVVMILISSIGFINNAYQLSPNIIILLGFALFFLALQKALDMPGISSWVLSLGLILLSFNFTGEFIVIAILILVLLPVISSKWRYLNYYLTAGIGILLFALLFSFYIWRLNSVNHAFLLTWQKKYANFIDWHNHKLVDNLLFYPKTLLWYVVPSSILVLWSVYKRQFKLFEDRILQACCLFILLLLAFAIISPRQEETVIFPILIPFTLIGSVEIDSIRISIVDFLNWFSIFIFGLIGFLLGILYITLSFGRPIFLLKLAKVYTPNYSFHFNIWQFSLAIIMAVIWLFMITREQIRGREMVTNLASGTTFCLILFISLCLPWFDDVLSFKSLVQSSKKHLLPYTNCIATNQDNSLQSALWYYFADVRLSGSTDFTKSNCSKALIASESQLDNNFPSWEIVWSGKRPIDKKYYILLKNKLYSN